MRQSSRTNKVWWEKRDGGEGETRGSVQLKSWKVLEDRWQDTYPPDVQKNPTTIKWSVVMVRSGFATCRKSGGLFRKEVREGNCCVAPAGGSGLP